MTLKRIDYPTISKGAEIEKILLKLNDRQVIEDPHQVHIGEHPELGHTIVIVRANGETTVLADEVRFL